MTKASIQEGGCTTPPRVPPGLVETTGALPSVAAISPLAVAGQVWMAARDSGGGVEGLSRVLKVSLVVWLVALAVSVLALVRSRGRLERVLSLVGFVGNLILLGMGLLGLTVSDRTKLNIKRATVSRTATELVGRVSWEE